MDTKKIFSWLLLLFGEALIITAFIVFGGDTAGNILALNIVVASLIYALFFIKTLVPWVDFNDKAQRTIGSMGIRWFVISLYSILAVALMILGNMVFDLTFQMQLVVHAILVFLVLLGLMGASRASEKVGEVYQQETLNRSKIVEMKNAMRSLKDRINETDNLPHNFTKQIDSFEDNLRFISPANVKEAYELENEYIKVVNDISYSLCDYSMNSEKIESNLKKLERIYQNRRNIYSN